MFGVLSNELSIKMFWMEVILCQWSWISLCCRKEFKPQDVAARADLWTPALSPSDKGLAMCLLWVPPPDPPPLFSKKSQLPSNLAQLQLVGPTWIKFLWLKFCFVKKSEVRCSLHRRGIFTFHQFEGRNEMPLFNIRINTSVGIWAPGVPPGLWALPPGPKGGQVSVPADCEGLTDAWPGAQASGRLRALGSGEPAPGTSPGQDHTVRELEAIGSCTAF